MYPLSLRERVAEGRVRGQGRVLASLQILNRDQLFINNRAFCRTIPAIPIHLQLVTARIFAILLVIPIYCVAVSDRHSTPAYKKLLCCMTGV